ncbi:MAG: beta-propeller domain-containing protein [Luteolibacter sp.]
MSALPRIFLKLAFVCVLAFLTDPVRAVEQLKLDLSPNHRKAEVIIPEGVLKISLQQGNGKNWRTYVSTRVRPGPMSFDLPATGDAVKWRAVIAKKRVDVADRKFPASFYRGKNEFGPALSDTGGGVSPWLWRTTNLNDMALGGEVATPDTAAPVEADIWKIDGGRVYFFNQLRGLQVLDLADPKNPTLVASLRMPAVGQDLYLLPGTGKTRELALLTEDSSRRDGDSTRILIVEVGESQAKVRFSQNVPGHLADSRMVGNRLIVATTDWSVGPNEKNDSALSEWLLETGKAPKRVGNFPITGDNPIIAAGGDWLAVSVTPSGQWKYSEVTVYGLGSNGLVRLTTKPIRTAGVIADKFKIQWSDNTLTTISESNPWQWKWSPRTVLENFRVWGPGTVVPAVFTGTSNRLGSLELAKGESLYATRFAGDKAYIVTFLQKDPLWIVDLSDPEKPVVSGHLQVPGWSTHLEPLGDLLFSIGWDSGSVVASLFDVANPALPTLLSRIVLANGYSEAAWDEKALKVLPDAGLVMVPLVTTDPDTYAQVSGVQLLDLDIAGRKLKQRGVISHDFEPRRADLIGDAVVSISQRVLVAADIEDRDKPTLLSEVSLAWPADRVCDAGDFVLQVEDGASYGDSRATVRVSPAGALEQILSETDLGDGSVRAAAFRDGKLFVIRQLTVDVAASAAKLIPIGNSGNSLVLDVYDGSALPALKLLGSCSQSVEGAWWLTVSDLLWPQANRPCLVVNSRGPVYWLDDIFVAKAKPMTSIYPPVNGQAGTKPQLLVFDVTKPDAPAADAAVSFGNPEASLNQVNAAGGGLVVVGASRTTDFNITAAPYFYPTRNVVHVLEVGQTGPAVRRSAIDLPGTLFAVTDLDGKGFLTFTRSMISEKVAKVQVSASDGFDAFLVASHEVEARAAVAAEGRRLFATSETGVSRFSLADDESWTTESELTLGWRPNALRSVAGKILGVHAKTIFSAAADGDTASRWRFPTWSVWLDSVSVAGNGDLLVPFGQYGVDRLGKGK